MQNDFRCFLQVDIGEGNRIAFAVFDTDVPMGGFLAVRKLHIEAVAIFQGVLSEGVFLSIIAAVRRCIELVDLNTRVIDEREILLAGHHDRAGSYD